jgi:hypothetical protein
MSTRRSLRLLITALGLTAVAAVGTVGDADAQTSGSRRRKVIRLGEFVVEGTVQKPQAFYILQRSNLNFEGLELKNSFVPKIIKSVEQPPF